MYFMPMLSLIWTFALHWCILQYQMILAADSKGPDHTARNCMLIRAFAVHICPETRFRMARPVCFSTKITTVFSEYSFSGMMWLIIFYGVCVCVCVLFIILQTCNTWWIKIINVHRALFCLITWTLMLLNINTQLPFNFYFYKKRAVVPIVFFFFFFLSEGFVFCNMSIHSAQLRISCPHFHAWQLNCGHKKQWS